MDPRKVWVLGILFAPGMLAPASQAADLTCGAGDIACVAAAIRTANGLTEPTTLRLPAGIYTLTNLYRALLVREPGPGEVAGWIDYVTPPFIEDQLIDSVEFMLRWLEIIS